MLFRNKSNSGDEHDSWVSYTDLMSGFLVVFIIVAVLIFNEYLKIRKTNLQNLITRYSEVFIDDPYIHHEIDTVRGSIVLTPMPGEKPLFENGGDVLSPALRRYIKTIGKGIVAESMEIWKTLGLKDIELRIEGHTDPNWRNSTDPNEIYINNLELSSKRANNVYQFMLDSLDLNEEEKDFMKRNMISIGYSYSRRLREGTSDVKDSALDSASRRIEFRIISK